MKGKLTLEGKEFEVTLGGFEFSDINTCPEVCLLVQDDINEFRELMFDHMTPVGEQRFKFVDSENMKCVLFKGNDNE